MPTDPRLLPALDEHEIAGVVIGWGFARDSREWEALAACFHQGAEMHISGTTGSAHAFIEGLKARPPAKPGEHTKHVIGSPRVRVRGSRAVSEAHANILSRALIEGYEFDFEAWVRFFDLFEKREGAWKIFRRTAIYEKDRMDPVVPGSVPSDFFTSVDMTGFPPECKFMCFRHIKQGRGIVENIVGVYSEAERALKEEGEAWLENFSDSPDRQDSGWPVEEEG